MLSVKSSIYRSPHFLSNPTLEQELSQQVHDMVNAINDRDFDSRSPAWGRATGDFVASTCFAELPPKTTNLEDFLHYMQLYTFFNPTYKLQVRDTGVTLNDKGSKAGVFVNFACAGSPPGTVRYSVGLLECEKMLGNWCCTRYQCLPGLVYEDQDSCCGF
ncbi:hypothetical protein AC578_5273 [Pseudocercospora eumusae]|uniref:SnoaL-like domain-containing protein n=1 Tax=Pseudocercospora eumusae TaxID=321146 RepID=A0A139GYV7_9PEZI|nr:hypothetical protein AC578_5273 [Pseudocercospora eumusae]KXS95332.1 hypothetical protein AC578_5273 [Pseudocercospora eumusae]